MPEVSLQIPQIGEGLQEARVVAFLKQPGDTVKRDDVIYQMETDKAVMDVESPYEGRVVKWLAEVDDVLSIGADILVMDTDEGSGDSTPANDSPTETTAEATSSGVVALQIPQIGEGLQEARLVAKLKEAGDAVKRDDIIYQMETDKAVMDVESPYNGTLVKWLAEVDDVLPIGTNVLEMETDEAAGSSQTTETKLLPDAPVATKKAAPSTSSGRRRDLPPRTRAYAKKKGLNDDQIAALPSTGKKLMPEDIDDFLAGESSTPAAAATNTSGKSFAEVPLRSQQRVLSSRLQRGSQLVVPGMMQVSTNWTEIEALRAEIKASGSDFQPSTFTLFAYAVAKAAADHPIVRSTLVGDSTVRTYDHLQLGIAVARPGDELVVAVVEDADGLSWRDFANQAWDKINLARDGKDQANESVTLSITNMQGYGIRDAMAVVVPPGVATIFLGEPHWGVSNDDQDPHFMRCANVGITIDHRLINGVGGAEFLNAVKHNVENIRELVS